MTLYERKTFTVPATGKAPERCEHGFVDRRGCCVFCGTKVAPLTTTQEKP